MADPVSTPVPAPPTGEQSATEPPEGPAGGVEMLKADLVKERRARQEVDKRNREIDKQSRDLAARLKEIEDRDKSDLDRAKESAEGAHRDLASARAEATRFRVAARLGISDEDAETFLTGIDEESITKQAQRLVEIKSTPTTPKPDPSQGAKTPLALNSSGLEQALRAAIGG